MKRVASTLLSVCIFLTMSGMALAAPSIVPTEKSVISGVVSATAGAMLKVEGDLAGKFEWVEVYYKTAQDDGKYIRRLTINGDSVSFDKAAVLGFNFGKGQEDFLMLDEERGFPGHLKGVSMIKGEGGKGAKLGFPQ